MNAVENVLNDIVSYGNTIFWDYILVYLLIGAGIYFTLGSKFVQFRLFGNMFKVITEEAVEQSGPDEELMRSKLSVLRSLHGSEPETWRVLH